MSGMKSLFIAEGDAMLKPVNWIENEWNRVNLQGEKNVTLYPSKLNQFLRFSEQKIFWKVAKHV